MTIIRTPNNRLARYYDKRVFSRHGAVELLLLSELFIHQRHKDDLLYGFGEEDGVCWGEDLRKNTVIFEHGFTRIERMFFCDGVAKIRGNPGNPCSRG